MTVLQSQFYMRAFQGDCPTLLNAENPARRTYRLQREHMLVLDERRQGFCDFAIYLLIKVKHILAVKLRP